MRGGEEWAERGEWAEGRDVSMYARIHVSQCQGSQWFDIPVLFMCYTSRDA